MPTAKTGKLITFTHLYTLPANYETVRLTLGIVQLDDGLKIIGQLKMEDPKIGMKVKGKVAVVRTDEYDKHLGMIFYKL